MLEFFSLDSIYRNKNEKRFTQKILKSRGASSQKIIQMMDSEENLMIESKSATLKYCLNIIEQNNQLRNDLKSISKEYFVGSIAYVFKAKLKNHNEYIAIKVLRENIEEKIKATMARISGGGKKKRQKMRRDNRERLRPDPSWRPQKRLKKES